MYRQRDPRYAGQEQHTAKPDALWDKRRSRRAKPKLFQPCDFQVAPDLSHCICPAGKRLYRSGTNCNIGGTPGRSSSRARSATAKIVRAQRPSVYAILQRTPIRQVAIFVGKHAKAQEKARERMKRKIDTDKAGR